ncbi:class I SAM-dependent methyltransferase [Baaleninema sp.]|uniref:class I SAM-dependent methyltransferase n=1 Tax=Baaleninema sp. TaxID=3101197 RepID=UPI003CFC6A6D
MNSTQNSLFLDPTLQPTPQAQPKTPTPPPNLAIKEKLQSTIGVRGDFQLPCMPTMREQYVKLIRGFLKVLGQNPTSGEIQAIERQLAKKLAEGFEESPQAYLTVTYQLARPEVGLSGGIALNITINSQPSEGQPSFSVAKSSRFGRYPDAKAMSIAAELGKAIQVPVLDIGAGIGRNSLPLAKRGHPVDAIPSNPQARKQLMELAQSRGLAVKVLENDVLDRSALSATYQLAIASEVLPHLRGIDRMRQFFQQTASVLQPGGVLLVAAFLTKGDYQPEAKVRELSEALGCYLLTEEDLKGSIESLPLQLISNESVVTYESQHLPNEAWPPSDKFLNWATGRELFPTLTNPPVELRWLQLRRI